jgi:type IV/VI secretion system ImpK/VasF family protein
MTGRTTPEGLLLDAFAEFHALLISLRDEVQVSLWSAETRTVPPQDAAEGTPASDEEAGARIANRVRNRLRYLLQEQDRRLSLAWGEDLSRQLARARYVMAALADAVFLSFQWSGREFWQLNLMETQLFGTDDAHDRIFYDIERLLREGKAADRELAQIYLSGLSLGLDAGRTTSTGAVASGATDVRRRLWDFISDGRPSLDSPSRELSRQAHAFTATEPPHRVASSARDWLVALVLLLLIYLLLSQVAWFGLTEPIREITDSIRALAGTFRSSAP